MDSKKNRQVMISYYHFLFSITVTINILLHTNVSIQ